VSEAPDDLLQEYVQEVLRFAAVMNLTAVRDAADFYNSFIEPSLALLPWIPQRGRLLDIGSGMGVPGVPVLLARPGLYGLLVERRRKRAEFLRHLVRRFKLRADVFDADVRSLNPLAADACVARAVSAPAAVLNMCTPHVRIGGRAVLVVSRSAHAVRMAGWDVDGDYDVPSAGEPQAVQVYVRQGDVSRET